MSGKFYKEIFESIKNFNSKLLTDRIKSISTIPVDGNECYLNIECEE